MLGIFQDIIQVLYLYKNSKLYYIHITVMGILLGLNIYFFTKQKQIQKKQQNPPQLHCSQKVDYVDYNKFIKTNTAKQLQNLQKSQQFQRYMQLRQDPNSRYYLGNKNYDDVQQIVLSDDSDDERYRKTR